MKKIFIIFALAFTHFFNVYGQKDRLDQLFDKYQEVEGVTSIKIAKPMFGMLSSLDLGDTELDQIKPLLSRIKGLKILIAEKPSDTSPRKGVASQISRDIASYLSNLNYSEIMTMNSSGAKIKFLSAEEKNGMLDDLLLSIDNGGKESILIKLDGQLSMDDISKLVNSSETKTRSSSSSSSFASESKSSYLNGENRNVGNFSAVEVSTGIILNFKQESPSSVKVIADADKLQYIVTKAENGVLKVFVDNKGQKNLKFRNVTVNVSAPVMNDIKASSGAIFNAVNEVSEKNLRIDVSSGAVVNGDFTVADRTEAELSSGAVINSAIDTKNLVIKASSGAAANLSGNADTGMIDGSSGSVCNAERLKFDILETEATSGAIVSGHAIEQLKAKASSGGIIKYKGNPKIESEISKTSGGALRAIN